MTWWRVGTIVGLTLAVVLVAIWRFFEWLFAEMTP
jgi:hypothetical protein